MITNFTSKDGFHDVYIYYNIYRQDLDKSIIVQSHSKIIIIGSTRFSDYIIILCLHSGD